MWQYSVISVLLFYLHFFLKKQTKACTNWRISLRFNIRRCMKTMETFESCFNVEILSCFLHFLINFFFRVIVFTICSQNAKTYVCACSLDVAWYSSSRYALCLGLISLVLRRCNFLMTARLFQLHENVVLAYLLILYISYLQNWMSEYRIWNKR